MVDLVAPCDLLQHRRRGLGIRQVDLPGLGGERVRRAAARKVDNVVAVAMQALGDAASDAPARAGDEGDGSGHDLPWRRLMSSRVAKAVMCRRLVRTSTTTGPSAASAARTAGTPSSLPAMRRPWAPNASARSEEHTSELQSLMRSSYAVFCLKYKKYN